MSSTPSRAGRGIGAREVVGVLASTRIFVFCSAWLIVLLVVGTVAQASIGLYLAQERYFSAWLLWAGPLPLPGGRLTMTAVFVNLLAMFLKRETWTWRRVGLKVTHFGALLLLFGGFLTAYTGSEGSMAIPEGQRSRYVADYRDLELAVVDESAPDHDDVVAFAQGWLRPGEVLSDGAVPFRIEVVEFFRNCRPERRDSPAGEPYRGFARQFALRPLPLDPEGERNRAGALLRVSGTEEADGIYAVVEHMSSLPSVPTAEGERVLVLRHARTYLPFELELIDFEKRLHPGTRMARSYRSELNLIENGTKRRTVIRMNQPLRHRGYTFYQASFIEGPEVETTVLAVVRNHGRVFPYVSSLVMCVGLLVHLVSHVPVLVGSPRRGAVK